MTDINATQAVAKVLAVATPGIADTQAVAKVIGEVDASATTAVRPTQVVAEVLASLEGNTPVKITQAVVRTIVYSGPEFGWIDMFEEVRFPEDISWGSQGGPGFLTDVLTVKSGADQRVSRWDQARYEFDVSHGVRTMEQLHALHNFFQAMAGQAIGFRYKDWLDYRSTFAVAVDARDAPNTSPTDQVLGYGDDLTTEFQLIKLYEYGTRQRIRTINKPVVGTVRVAMDGVEVTNWTLDSTTGVVTFVPRFTTSSNAIRAVMMSTDLQYVKFENVGTDGDFEGFRFGDRIQVDGFANPALNTGGNTEWYTIEEIATDASYIIARGVEFDTASLRANENAGQLVTINVHPAPDYGVEISAGFEFDVPVRFATDKMPTRLDAFGVGGVTSIPLVEVRVST